MHEIQPQTGKHSLYGIELVFPEFALGFNGNTFAAWNQWLQGYRCNTSDLAQNPKIIQSTLLLSIINPTSLLVHRQLITLLGLSKQLQSLDLHWQNCKELNSDQNVFHFPL